MTSYPCRAAGHRAGPKTFPSQRSASRSARSSIADEGWEAGSHDGADGGAGGGLLLGRDAEQAARGRDALIGWPQRRQRANLSMAAGVTGVKKLTRLPSGSRNSSDRLPHGIVVGSLTKSSTKSARLRCTRSTSSTRNSMMTVLLSAGRAAPEANSGTVRALAMARVAEP